MRERVSTIIGKKPVILVAPHGSDDTNTALLTEAAAKKLDCFAVINQGFERAEYVDVEKDIADCNKINHCKEEVVFDEFLKPIIKFKEKLIQRIFKSHITKLQNMQDFSVTDSLHIFYVHGCGDIVHKEANESVGVIIGYGLGNKKDSLTCDLWRKNLFVDLWNKYTDAGCAFQGKCGGKYAGRDSNNLNQYFRKHEIDLNVQSMQLEFPFSKRKTEEDAKRTGKCLALCLESYFQYKHYENMPRQKLI
jgi:hypothetical protein